jgi:hypothetical protein
VELWVAGRTAAGRVDVVAAEVAAPVESGLERQVREVLVAKCNDFALGDEERKLVFCCQGQLAELDASDFGADARGELLDGAVRGKQIFKGAIGTFAMFNVGEWLQWRIFFTVVPSGEVLWILRTQLISKRP